MHSALSNLAEPRGESKQLKACGFTLVELLVVIGIIALLISILLPSLSKVRESGNTVKCLANMRSIGQAMNLYTSENKGCLVPGAYLDLPYANGFISDNYATILIVSGFLEAPPVKSIGAGPSDSSSVFFCPNGLTDQLGVYYSSSGTAKPAPPSRKDGLGARCWRASSALQPGLIVDTWYGINASWNNQVANPPIPIQVQPDSIGSTFSYQYRKSGSILYASEMVCLYDGTFYDLAYDANRMNARHNKQTTTNLLFFDGHAASIPTSTLPGGIGNANNGSAGGSSNPFYSAANLANYPTPKFRLDQ